MLDSEATANTLRYPSLSATSGTSPTEALSALGQVKSPDFEVWAAPGPGSNTFRVRYRLSGGVEGYNPIRIHGIRGQAGVGERGGIRWYHRGEGEGARTCFVPLHSESRPRCPDASVQIRSTVVDPVTVGTNPVGASGRSSQVVAPASLDGAEQPPPLQAETR